MKVKIQKRPKRNTLPASSSSSFVVAYAKQTVTPAEFIQSVLSLQQPQQGAVNEQILDNNHPVVPPYNPYDLDHLQWYSPLLERFFERFFILNESNYQSVGFQLPSPSSSSSSSSSPIHMKSCPLIDPFLLMKGKFEDRKEIESPSQLPVTTSHMLPTRLREHAGPLDTRLKQTIYNPNNAAYVDTFFAYLSHMLKEQHNVFHGLSFYGTCQGIQKVHRFDVTDDVHYLQSLPFFQECLKQGRVSLSPNYHQFYDEWNTGSRANRHRIRIEDTNNNNNNNDKDGDDNNENDMDDEINTPDFMDFVVPPPSNGQHENNNDNNDNDNDNDDDDADLLDGLDLGVSDIQEFLTRHSNNDHYKNNNHKNNESQASSFPSSSSSYSSSSYSSSSYCSSSSDNEEDDDLEMASSSSSKNKKDKQQQNGEQDEDEENGEQDEAKMENKTKTKMENKTKKTKKTKTSIPSTPIFAISPSNSFSWKNAMEPSTNCLSNEN